MKKRILSIVLFIALTGGSFAQEVTLKAGTLIPLQIANSVKAADIEKAQKVLFKVSRDINIGGVTTIPYGATPQRIL
jgi:hypothetical protein